MTGVSHETDFRVAELTGTVRSNDARFIDDFRRLFYQRARPSARPDASYRVFVDRRFSLEKRHTVTTGDDPEEIVVITAFYPSILAALEHHICRRIVATLSSYCLLEASCLSCDGRGLLIAGSREVPIGRLLQVLVERGCVFFGHGLAILDRTTQRVIPFPKGISLTRPAHPLTDHRRQEATFRDRERVAIRYIPPPPAARPQDGEQRQIDSVVFVRSAAGREPQASPVGKAESLERLMALGLGGPASAAADFGLLADLVDRSSSCEVGVGSISATSRLLLEVAGHASTGHRATGGSGRSGHG
jgi:hypothetical protein